jgi:DNA invertase Pin-like site-specific DNA recombinase
MKTTAIYLRVSTEMQDTAHQRVTAENYVAATFPDTNTEIYEDLGISGAVSDRPALERLLIDVKAGKVSRIVMFEWSRLSRDFMFGLHLMETLTAYSVPVFVPGEGQLKFSSAMDQFMVAVKAFGAASERERIAERVKSGIARVKATGKKWGQKPADFHSCRGRRKDYDAALIAQVLELRDDGKSFDKIADELRAKGIKVSGTMANTIYRRSTAKPQPA